MINGNMNAALVFIDRALEDVREDDSPFDNLASAKSEILKGLENLEAQRDYLLCTLRNSLHCLEQVNQDGKTITDTIWFDENTTLFDYMQIAIEKSVD